MIYEWFGYIGVLKSPLLFRRLTQCFDIARH